MADTPVTELERRKQVRLRLRRDVSITPQKYEGRTYYVVKDPVSLRYYRFKEQERFLLGLMDGGHTLEQAQKEFEKRFRPDRLTLEDLEHFGQQLLTAGLAQNESPQAGKQLFERRSKRRRTQILQMFTNILYIKIPVFDPERILTGMMPYMRWIFSLWFTLFSVGFMLGAVVLVLTHFQTFRDRLPSYHEFFSFKTAIYLWAALGVVKVIHEFGHGLSCKYFGGEVHEMGFLFLCLSPCMYCNVSDAWTLPNKWHRMIISGAGIYVELMIAALATFIWWNTPSQPFVNNLALSLMVVCSVSTVVFNGNPLMRFDGYYVLADWIEIPNLRDRANRYLQRVVMEHALGIELQPEPYMALGRRILFVTYAVFSYFYRWMVTFVILTFLASFLKPYKLEIVSNMLAMMALGSMVGWPLYRLGKNLHKRGRFPDMKPHRVTASACLVALLLFGFFLLPLPVSRIRQMGVVQVQPQDIVQVHVEVGGRLKSLDVREGEKVKKGKILATFTSQDLETRAEEHRTQWHIKSQLLKAYDQMISGSRDPKEKEDLNKSRGRTLIDRKAAKKLWEETKLEMERLTLRAPSDGVVMGLPPKDEVGKRWEKEMTVPFCTIADPSRLRVQVPVAPLDNDLIRENLNKSAGRPLDVTIRVHGHASRTWKGRVSHTSESEARTIPVSLSTKGGGPLAIKFNAPPQNGMLSTDQDPDNATRPPSDPHQVVPQSQVYLIGISFNEPDASICPGALAQVKIHCEYRSCAWWVWRALSQTFDLGLW